MTMELWEVLVPTVRPNGKPYKTRYHRVWDAKVQALTGGLTVMKPAKGSWRSPEGTVFTERMIPVRIACSAAQIDEIMTMTLEYYEQAAVMVYRISDLCLIKHRD